MKKIILSLITIGSISLSSLFNNVYAAKDITITVPTTTEEIKESAGEVWNKTKMVTTKAGIVSGQTLKNVGEALEQYSLERKEKIDKQIEKDAGKGYETVEVER